MAVKLFTFCIRNLISIFLFQNPNHTSTEPTSNGDGAEPNANLFTVIPKVNCQFLDTSKPQRANIQIVMISIGEEWIWIGFD